MRLPIQPDQSQQELCPRPGNVGAWRPHHAHDLDCGVLVLEMARVSGPTEDGVVKAMFGDVSTRAVPVFYENYQWLLSVGVSPFSTMRSLLSASRVKGYRLAVVTGKSERGSAMTLDALGLVDEFELVRGGSDDGIVKSAAMTEILDVWDIAPAAYIGDHPLDVLEARSVDVLALSAGWASTVDLEAIKAVHPDELFLRVEDLAAWLCVEGIMEG